MKIKPAFHAATVAASLLLAGLACPASAFAQNDVLSGDSAATAAKPKAPAAKPLSPADRIERHIAHLHAQLQITPAQQTQWDQFAQVMRDNANAMGQVVDQRGAKFATMNAAENMQSYVTIAQQHARDTEKLAAAFQTLYDAMSDAQKKNADAFFRARGDHPTHRKG